MNASKYPLAWPEGWDRTVPYKRKRAPYKVSGERAVEHLHHQLKLMGGQQVILSTNIVLRNDGRPYANQPKHMTDDPGAAVYWSTNAFKDRVIACDKWHDVYDNIHALGLAIFHMRGVDRSGASQVMNKAFSAFGALPAAAGANVQRPWWEVFGFKQELLAAYDRPMAEARYRTLAASAHPDKGGSAEAMTELNRARDAMIAHYARGG
jgi:hypothetical protein